MAVVILFAIPSLVSFCAAVIVIAHGVLAWRKAPPALPPARVVK